MVKFIVGKKGSGKTKALIESANKALESSKGKVVYIEKGSQMIYDLDSKVRLINVDEYRVDNFEAMYGFISGILACNYDVTDIFVDGIFKTVGKDAKKLVFMAKQLEKLEAKVNIIFTVSCELDELPMDAKDFID